MESLSQQKREVHELRQGRYKLEIKSAERESEVNLARDLKKGPCDYNGEKGGLSPAS